MLAQRVVVIQDASNKIDSKVFHWAPNGLSFKQGDMLILVAVLHQVITPLGCKISVDSRLAFGANQKIIEAEVARKKEEYMKNEELSQIYKLYKSMKVGFKIEIAMGSSPKAVALKSATKLKATLVILDRKMKNDEEYFLQKLTCGISRIRSSNRIIRLREPLDKIYTPQQKQGHTSSEIYANSSTQDFSTELDLFSIDISPNTSHASNYQMNQDQGQRQKSHDDEVEYSTLDSNKKGDTNPYQLSMDRKDVHSKMQEEDSLSTKVYQKSERYTCSGGARNFFLGGTEEYEVCEQIFSLSDFSLRN